MKRKIKIKLEVFLILIIAFLFILISYITQQNIDKLTELIGDNVFLSVFIYMTITILEIIFAPLTTIPLIPIASNIWGWFWAAIITVIGWTLGSTIAFFLARKYGRPIIKKFVSLQKVEKFEGMVPEHNIFLSIVLIRIALPFDVMSYALGLFTKINYRTFISASLLGFFPLAIILAYVGVWPFYYQITGLLIAILILLVGLLIRKKRKNKKILS